MRTCPKCLNPRNDSDFTRIHNKRSKVCIHCEPQHTDEEFKAVQDEQTAFRKATTTISTGVSDDKKARIKKVRYGIYDYQERKRIEADHV